MPEELAQEEILGVDADVGLELALPPAVLVLKVSQALRRRLGGGRHLVLPCRGRPAVGRSPAGLGCHRSRRSRQRSRSVTKRAISASSVAGPGSRSTRRRAARAASKCWSANAFASSLAPVSSISRVARATSAGGQLAGQEVGELGPASVRRGEGGHHRQGLLVGVQVAPDRLADVLDVAPDAEQVVDRLEARCPGGHRSPRGPRSSSSVAPARVAPMAVAAARRAPVLPASMARHSSTDTVRAGLERHVVGLARRSCVWVAATSVRTAATRAGVGSSNSTSTERVARASPAMMAGPVPKAAHTVGRCRRSRSPSMMSSWRREKLCTSSIATAPGIPTASGAPQAAAETSTSAARTRLPPPARWWRTGSWRAGAELPDARSQLRRHQGDGAGSASSGPPVRGADGGRAHRTCARTPGLLT